MKKILFLFMFIFSFSCKAENIICNELTGIMFNPVNKKYENIDGSGKMMVHIQKETATVINGNDKVECIIVNDDPKFVTFMNVTPLTSNMFTYFKNEKRLFYSKHTYFMNSQSQYTTTCKIME